MEKSLQFFVSASQGQGGSAEIVAVAVGVDVDAAIDVAVEVGVEVAVLVDDGVVGASVAAAPCVPTNGRWTLNGCTKSSTPKSAPIRGYVRFMG